METEHGAGPELVRELAELVHARDRDRSPAAILHRLIDIAVRDVPGADHAGVTMLTQRHLSSEAWTDEMIHRLDAIQHELAEGPCVESARAQRTIRVEDTGHETRWPQFIAHATELGVRSILSVELFAGDSVSAALNLYAMSAAAFTAESEDLAVMLAAPAGLALGAARKIDNLTVALESRDLIGQAKGILMERHKITSSEAFDLLVVASQRMNRKLRDIADDLTATGQLALPPP